MVHQPPSLTEHPELPPESTHEELIKLERYRPIYFLMGSPNTKVQLSLKVPLFPTIPLYFAYTQLMMWELFRSDPYFSDLNYDPEIFYRIKFGGSGRQWLDLGPIEHESNGKGGADERSWNRSYLRVQSQSYLGTKARLIWSFKIWFSYFYNPANPDIEQYRGIWELELNLTQILISLLPGAEVNFRLYPGGSSEINPLRGGQEFTFLTRNSSRKILPLLLFQVFHGYGENLLAYKDLRWGVRAGVGF